MLIPFDQMPKTARIWIYQADRSLTEAQQKAITQTTSQFVDQWAAHGNPLKSAFQLLYDQFLVIAVDESYNEASGCSIDASVGLVKHLEKELEVSFFDRTQVAFLVENQVFSRSMKDIKELVTTGEVSEDTLTFNNLVANVGQLDNEWLVPAGNSWLKRYF